jgi:elongation factor P
VASISMSQLKKGLRIEMDGHPYRITDYQHVKPGKGAAFVRTKIKSLLNGRVIEKTFHAGDKCETPNLENVQMQYLYHDGEFFQFMDTTSYEQIGLTDDQVGDVTNWILESMMVDMLLFNEKPIAIEPPAVVELEITETAPNFKGDTTNGGKKPATLETGVVVNVPFHVLTGDKIRVDTKESAYIEKVK